MGWAIDKFQKSSFETDFYGIETVYDEGSIKHHFYTLGLRYNFALHHGIELASKLKGRLNFDDKSAVKTDITWGHTLNLRYVYEFYGLLGSGELLHECKLAFELKNLLQRVNLCYNLILF